VVAKTDLVVTNPSDLDLESQIQFVHGNQAVVFDFSAFVLVDENHPVEDATKEISAEIHAFDALLEAVKKAHSDFLSKAFEAIDTLKQGAPVA
jgi:hypothetical protein